MLLACYLTGAFCVAATGAWYVLRKDYHAESRIMLRMGLGLAAVLIPIQLFFGHLCGDYVHKYQPAKFAAIEGRWHDEQPAGEVLIAIPDPTAETNRYEIKIPVLGSVIGSMSLDSKEVGLTSFPQQDRPPVAVPFFGFRIMVGCGLVMLGLAWLGTCLSFKRRLERNRLLLWLTFLSFPLPFIAIITGWFTAEVGRQPWVVYGVFANRGRHDAVLDDACGLQSRSLSSARSTPSSSCSARSTSTGSSYRSCWQAVRDAAPCGRQPADVAGQRKLRSFPNAVMSALENSHGHVLGRALGH